MATDRERDADVIAHVVDTYDYVWQRLIRRIEGLTDEEYLWEPAPGCWTVHRTLDGRVRADPGVWPEVRPSPFTTIAWRLCHIADNFTEDRVARFFGMTRPDEGSGDHPMTAADALAYVTRAYAVWLGYLDELSPERIWDTLDEEGRERSRTMLRFILQYLEEFAHHAAEVAVLRDLYRARFGTT